MKTGRPLKYNTAEELDAAIDAYFAERTEDKLPPTISGLALYLGFADRQSLYDYKGREEFSCIIKKAITKIEDFAEGMLFSGLPATGAIFWLKNHKWTDKTVQDVNVTGYSLFEDNTQEKAKKYDTSTVEQRKKTTKK